jgi:hypothetical protein
MADWFSEMVAEVADEVVSSSETATRLASTDRVTAGDLRMAAMRSENELRTQFGEAVRSIQTVRDEMLRLERDVLAHEWQAIGEAERLADAGPSSQPESSLAVPLLHILRVDRGPIVALVAAASVGVVAIWLLVGTRPADLAMTGVATIFTGLFARRLRRESGTFLRPNRLTDDSAAQATQALSRARDAYDKARESRRIDQLSPTVRLEANRTELLAGLRQSLIPALILRVNGVIDGVLDASYDRHFSYQEPAVLTDPLELTVEPVNTDSYHKLKYLIEKVGSGTIGVAGPRGSGKSTLLSRFALTVKISDEPKQWGVCVAAPTKYDSRDFLLFLFSELCKEVLGPARARRIESRFSSAQRQEARDLRSLPSILLATTAALICAGVVVGLRAASLGESPRRMIDLQVASCCAVVCLLTLPVATRRLRFAPYPPSFPVLSRPWSSPVFPALMLLSGIAATALYGLLSNGVTVNPAYLASGGLVLLGGLGILVLRPVSRVGISWVDSDIDDDEMPVYDAPRYSLEPRYLSVASDWYARVKFQQSFTTGWSGTVTVGAPSLPVQLQAGQTGSTAVTPLAMSTPEIVQAIRDFTRVMAGADSRPDRGNATHHVPVVVGIDEVDKIEDPQEAQGFLNQIKGLFGDSNCLFLISISDDAMAAFERRGMPFRDAFDSSLSSVVTLSYLSRKEARVLVGSRLVNVEEPIADLLYVLAAGLARDLVRLVRKAVEAKEQGKTGLDELAQTLIAVEVDAKRKAVLARSRTLEQCPAKDQVLAWALGGASGTGDPEDYFAGQATEAGSLIGSACDGASLRAHHPVGAGPDNGSCTAKEIGVFSLWAATVGQAFGKCATREDFREGEAAEGAKSFDRMAQARQSFPLGPDLVLKLTKDVRSSWDLPAVFKSDRVRPPT